MFRQLVDPLVTRRWYRGLKDMQDGCWCTDPLLSLSLSLSTWTGSPTLNQARLTDAGQSAWNLRVTCPRRPPLRLNHRLPPTRSRRAQRAPPPLLSSCPFLPVRGIYTGEAGFDLAEYAAATDDSLLFTTRPTRRYTPPPPPPQQQ